MKNTVLPLSTLVVLCASLAFASVVAWERQEHLRVGLEITQKTLENSIRAGDWDLALGHIKSVIAAGQYYGIEVRSNSGEILAGPIGEPGSGIGAICQKITAPGGLVTVGCIRFFGRTEIVLISFFLIFSVLLLLLYAFVLRIRVSILMKAFSSEIGRISELVTEDRVTSDLATPSQDSIREIQQMRGLVIDLVGRAQQGAHASALGSLATQVAHDIRSPLAAINSMEKDLAILPEDTRLMLRGAVSRIRDIANNLLEKNREMKSVSSAGVSGTGKVDGSTTMELATPHLLSSLLDPLITEKRMQFRSNIGIEIDGRIDAGSYGLFASIQPTEFKRVISNLINNAVEALGERGSVLLSLLGRDSEIEITIRDNGLGISPDILAKLGQRGESHGKEGGSGLGLFHARASVESWGGKLKIESEVGKGTAVIVMLPRASAPGWFVSTLSLTPGSSVVILDDDSSIHQIWQGRMDSLRVSEKQIAVVHVSTPDQLRNWVRENPAGGQALYLADYELLGFKETGLSLIEELKLAPQSILVTSRFEERQIMEGCQRLKVRLIPKGMAGFVPVSFGVALEAVDAILIDDDNLVHMTWMSAAKSAGKSLKAFSHPDQFFASAEIFTKTSPVYVDANLGRGIKGEEVAERIHNMGFTRVFLATGYEPEKYNQYKFLAGVLGKDPPFGDHGTL